MAIGQTEHRERRWQLWQEDLEQELTRTLRLTTAKAKSRQRKTQAALKLARNSSTGGLNSRFFVAKNSHPMRKNGKELS
jgi:hypothetical protein